MGAQSMGARSMGAQSMGARSIGRLARREREGAKNSQPFAEPASARVLEMSLAERQKKSGPGAQRLMFAIVNADLSGN